MPQEIQSKTILNKTKRRDPWFLDDYTLNPYSGCSFNCLFCYIRGSKYGTHMERKMTVKSNAVELLDKQLGNRAKKDQFGIIVLSSATDPYLQIEKETELTKRLLEVVLKHRFPLHVITRSDLVLRDLDLLKLIDERAILPKDLRHKLEQKVFVTFSFSTINDEVAHIFEPGATKPTDRLMALEKTTSHGLLTGVSMMPLLPFISDTEKEMEKMLIEFKQRGAQYAFPASLTLFGNGPTDGRTLTMNAVKKHYPELELKYQEIFSYGFRPSFTYQKMIENRAQMLCHKMDLRQRIPGT